MRGFVEVVGLHEIQIKKIRISTFLNGHTFRGRRACQCFEGKRKKKSSGGSGRCHSAGDAGFFGAEKA